jgi:hypothetical protein
MFPSPNLKTETFSSRSFVFSAYLEFRTMDKFHWFRLLILTGTFVRLFHIPRNNRNCVRFVVAVYNVEWGIKLKVTVHTDRHGGPDEIAADTSCLELTSQQKQNTVLCLQSLQIKG